MKSNVIWAVVLVIAFFAMSQNDQTSSNTFFSEEHMAALIDADVVFNGQDKYVAGTALSSESVRILKLDGSVSDLGSKTLNSGTLAVVPGTDYNLYFFMDATNPSSSYYVDIQEYTGKNQDSADNIIGMGCAIDTTPTVIVRNENGRVMTSSGNAQSISTGETKSVEVEIRAHSDKCFGMPDSPKKNAVCFAYSTTAFSSVKANTAWLGIPSPVANLVLGNMKCFAFDTLGDGGRDILTVDLVANGEPTDAHNITIFLDDIAFDLDRDTLSEIHNFADEDGNELGRVLNASLADGYIYVS